MKVAIDIRPLRDVMTGIGRYVSKMIEALVGSDDGNEYILFYNNFKGDNPRGLPQKGNFRLAYFRWPSKALTAIWAFSEYPKVERFIGRIDLFHSPSFQVPPSRHAARVFTIFDLIPIAYPEMAIPSAVRHFKPRLRHYVSRADLIVAISRATAEDVKKLLGVPDEKIAVVYPGTSPLQRACAEDISSVKRKYSIDKDFILFVSRLDPRKNLPRLFRAFERSGLFRDFDFIVVGPKGWHMEEMYETWRVVSCHDQIKWLYYVTDQELAALYSGAAFFVYPSLVEGFGLPILEAMSVDCPVLTSCISSMPEVAGEAALYVDPFDVDSIEDGLLKLASDTALRKRLSQLGRERIKLFAWNNTAREMAEVYKRATTLKMKRN